MTQPIEPREAEAMAVTLVRIETGVGNILEKVTEVRAEVVVHRGQIGTIESKVQQLQSDAKVAAKAVIDAEDARQTTAELLKEATEKTLKEAKAADDKKVADAKTLVEQSTTKWSPALRMSVIFGTVFAGLVVLIAAVVAFRSGMAPVVPLK